MECRTCGRTSQNENANFCDYCGTSFKDRGFRADLDMNPAEEQERTIPPLFQPEMQAQRNQPWMQGTADDRKEEKPISFWIFFGVMVVGLIPGIGLLIQIAVLAVFAFGKQTSKVARNWARAFLLFNIVSFFVSSYLLMPLLENLLGTIK